MQSEVAAISVALGQLADGLASMLLVGSRRPMTARGRGTGRPRRQSSRNVRAADCFHRYPSLKPGMSARCARCPTTLHRVGPHSLDYSIALTVGALVMLIIMCATTLMNVQTAGIVHQAGLFSGPVELVHRGMAGSRWSSCSSP